MTDFVQEECCSCGVVFGMTRTLNDARRADKASFYCPNGHGQSYTQNEADRLKAQLQKQEQETQRAKDAAERERRWRQEATENAEHLERRLAAQKGVTTRLKNRVANGVCPCCNRTFANLARHMNTKHAGFVAEEVQTEVGQTIQYLADASRLLAEAGFTQSSRAMDAAAHEAATAIFQADADLAKDPAP